MSHGHSVSWDTRWLCTTTIASSSAPSRLVAALFVPESGHFGQGLFGHTSPIYIDYIGKRVFQAEIAKALVQEMESAMDEILKRSKFAGDAQKMQVLRVYEKGIDALERRLASDE